MDIMDILATIAMASAFFSLGMVVMHTIQIRRENRHIEECDRISAEFAAEMLPLLDDLADVNSERADIVAATERVKSAIRDWEADKDE